MYTVVKEIELPELIIRLLSNDIVHVTVKKHTEITVEAQESFVIAYNELTTVKLPFIFESEPFLTVTKEARKNAPLIEKRAPILCSALVTKNLGQKLLADYYYKFNAPSVLTKIFTTKEKAIEWSLSQVKTT